MLIYERVVIEKRFLLDFMWKINITSDSNFDFKFTFIPFKELMGFLNHFALQYLTTRVIAVVPGWASAGWWWMAE
jgi:hypothetical protein